MTKIGLLLVLLLLLLVAATWIPRERFVPMAPSKTGDQKTVTASGNVILF